MTYPYPPHLKDFSYVGRHSYALEFTTLDRRSLFTNPETVNLTVTQILRAGRKKGFARGETLWQRYGYERAIRTDVERVRVIAYVVANPVTAGLVAHAPDYPFLGSEIYSMAELLAICDSAGT